jgi:hypothetical protein
LLVRVENTPPRHIRDMVVLDLAANLIAPDRPYLQRMFVAVYAPGTCLDAANSRHSSAFRLLAPRLWEWTGAAAIFAFLCATVFLTSSRSIVPSAVTRHQKGSSSCS